MTRTRKSTGTRLQLLRLACLTASVVMPFARDASACSPPPSGWSLETATESGPAAGPIAFDFRCFEYCESATKPEIVVTDAQGNEVEGAIIESEFSSHTGWALWKPAAELTEGASYGLESDPDSFSSPRQYRVTTEPTPELPEEQLHLSVMGFVELTGEACCEESAGAGVECESPRCYPDPSNARARVRLSAYWGLPESQLAEGHILLAGEFYTGKERIVAQPSISLRLEGELSPTDPSDKYCYKITARDLHTTKETVLEECVDAGTVSVPDAASARQTAQRSNLRGCSVPKAQYQDQWCEAFEAELMANACPLSANGTPCINARAECEPPSDSSGSSVPSDPSSHDPQHTKGIPRSTSTGCSLTTIPARTPGWAWLAVITVLLASGRRRKRAASETCTSPST